MESCRHDGCGMIPLNYTQAVLFRKPHLQILLCGRRYFERYFGLLFLFLLLVFKYKVQYYQVLVMLEGKRPAITG